MIRVRGLGRVRSAVTCARLGRQGGSVEAFYRKDGRAIGGIPALGDALQLVAREENAVANGLGKGVDIEPGRSFRGAAFLCCFEEETRCDTSRFVLLDG